MITEDDGTTAAVDDGKTKGLIADLQDERSKRQDADRRADNFEVQLGQSHNEMAGMQERMDALETSTAEPEVPDYEPDEYLTASQTQERVNAGVKKAMDARDKADAKRDADVRQKHLGESETSARRELTSEKQGDGLDFDTVINEGFRPMAIEIPAYTQAVAQSSDPAKEAYKLGLTHPNVAARVEAARNANLAERIGSSRSPRGGSSSSIVETEESDFMKLVHSPDLDQQLEADEARIQTELLSG